MLTKIQRWISKYDWEAWGKIFSIVCASFAGTMLFIFFITILYYIILNG